ncbi:MAG: plasmid pRiA4b ORF-3 family protein [Peptococcaceae bacterium]|nr:plasmid pRiA4b ORF-3 family protein [Peptococcaceae bacterium]
MKALYFSATLKDSVAPVWRRFAVPMNYTFQQLHDVLQIIFGYSGKEDFEFVFKNPKLRITMEKDLYERYLFLQSDEGKHYLAHKKEEGFAVDTSVEVAWAETLPLDPLTLKHREFEYIYDFSDDWTYDLELVDIIEEGENFPVVREGLGNAPFEACGGFDGYYELVDILTTPDHPDNEEIRVWVEEMGYQFYDQDDVNDALRIYGATQKN